MADSLPILEWVDGLVAIPERDFAIERVHSFISQHPIQPDSLNKYLFFSKANYTRNLIFKNNVFECIAICWEVGQISRIHNHRGQNCWMATPIGRLRVQNFLVEDRDASRASCRIVPADAYEMNAAQPAFVDPAAPVHQVLNLSEFHQRAASIHVYSKPFDSCEIYLRERGSYADVPLHYTSEYGKLNPDEKLL
jgi:cysteine dioxygenase